MYDHISSLLYNTPLLVTETRLDVILEAVNSRILGLNLSKDLNSSQFDQIKIDAKQIVESRLGFGTDSNDREDRKPYAFIDGVAIITISGNLTNRSMGLSALSGNIWSYSGIADAWETALKDDAVKHIVLDIHSNGGEASGLFDLSDLIYNSRNEKPNTAIINDVALSAGYGIASAVKNIICTRTSQVGSIGVVAAHRDQSKRDADMGIKYTFITGGANKAELSQHKKLSNDAKSRLQEDVDKMYRMFAGTIARNRGLSVDDVLNQEANVYSGNDALSIGLVDKIDSARNALGGIIDSVNIQSSRIISNSNLKANNDSLLATHSNDEGVMMATSEISNSSNKGDEVVSTKVKENPIKAETKSDQNLIDANYVQTIINVCTEAGFPTGIARCINAKLEGNPLLKAIDEFKQIKAACEAALLPDLYSKCISEGMTATQVKASLFDHVVKPDSNFKKSLQINSKDNFLSSLLEQDESAPVSSTVIPSDGLSDEPTEQQLGEAWKKSFAKSKRSIK